MTTAQAIAQHLQALPDSVQREVLDFVEFLASRRRSHVTEEDGDVRWSDFSLASAMRGMEEEATPYTPADMRETFK